MTYKPGEKGVKLSTERRRPDAPEEVRARHERMHRLIDELRESVERKKAIVARWRAEGRLPPEEPRRAFKESEGALRILLSR
jgi:hypothetical protein